MNPHAEDTWPQHHSKRILTLSSDQQAWCERGVVVENNCLLKCNNLCGIKENYTTVCSWVLVTEDRNVKKMSFIWPGISWTEYTGGGTSNLKQGVGKLLW